ncbi:MAG TPA: hypothetical protein PLY80_20280, partial [Pseudomonadota bacterium]|nr:hypothetical protein [Pseudomonadota bacterium]
MSRLHLTLPLCSLGFFGCDNPSPTDQLPVEPALSTCSLALPDPQTKSTASAEVAGASACLSVHPSEAAQTPMPLVAVRKGQDLSLDGYKTLGPAVMLQLGQPVGQRGVDVTLPFAFLQIPENARTLRHRLVVLSRFGQSKAHVTAVENITVSTANGGQLRFHLPGHGVSPLGPEKTLSDVATFQVAMPTDLGATVKRKFSYRAVAGMS